MRICDVCKGASKNTAVGEVVVTSSFCRDGKGHSVELLNCDMCVACSNDLEADLRKALPKAEVSRP